MTAEQRVRLEQHVGVKKWNMARSTAIEVRKVIRTALTPSAAPGEGETR